MTIDNTYVIGEGELSILKTYHTPFKTPLDYWIQACGRSIEGINNFREFLDDNPVWKKEDCELHVYPYTQALPAMLSMGCERTCAFCGTAAEHKGHISYGDYNVILPKYKCQCTHFMDEDFFLHPQLDDVLNMLSENEISWTCMSTSKSLQNAIDKYGHVFLQECGLVAVEVGLENISLFKKVQDNGIQNHGSIVVIYLSMSFLPGETFATCRENAVWFIENVPAQDLIHHNNGAWYAPGQYYHPTQHEAKNRKGYVLRHTPVNKARAIPTFVPKSFMEQEIDVPSVNISLANWWCQLVYGFKLFPIFKSGITAADFIMGRVKFSFEQKEQLYDCHRAMWLAIAGRVGAIGAEEQP